MNLGGPAAPGLADGLRSVSFNAPVPSGCTLTMVLSIETASSLMRTICSRWRYSNTLSSTPFFDHRFIRVYTVCQLPNRLGNPRHLHPCFAPKVNLRLMVRQAHHERKYENPFALSLSKGDLAKQGTFGAKLLHPCSATYSMAFSTCRLDSLTLPR